MSSVSKAEPIAHPGSGASAASPEPGDRSEAAQGRAAAPAAASPGPSAVVTVQTDAAAWDRLVAAHPSGNIFCSWAWGTYKEATGWSVERLRIDDATGRPLAICAISSKRKLGLRVFHIQGGPLLHDDDDERGKVALEAALAHIGLTRRDLLFVSPYYFGGGPLKLALLAAGFRPVINSGDFTLLLDLSGGQSKVEAGLNRSWRRYLKKSAQSLVARYPEDAEERRAAVARFAPMYQDLARRKHFEAKTSIPDLANMVANDPRWIVVEVLDGSEVVAIRIAHLASGGLVTDWLAATSEAALRTNAGYFAMWSLVERAIALGATRLDCGGIDPFNNPGVFRFKRGISRNVCQSEPVWLFGRSRIVRSIVSAYLVSS